MTTRQSDIEIIRKAAIAANPGIMELEFGCNVRIDDSKNDGEYSIWRFVGGEDGDLWNCIYSSFATVTWGKFKIEGKPYVILGRDIQSADVLYAISRLTPHAIAIEGDGCFMQYMIWEDTEEHEWRQTSQFFKIRTYWNHSETLEGQSDETIRALAALLGNE